MQNSEKHYYKYKKYKSKYKTYLKNGGSIFDVFNKYANEFINQELSKYNLIINIINKYVNMINNDASKEICDQYMKIIYKLFEGLLNNEIPIDNNPFPDDKILLTKADLIKSVNYNALGLKNCTKNDEVVPLKECYNFNIYEDTNFMFIKFKGSQYTDDAKTDISLNFYDNFHTKIFSNTTRFIFRNNKELYNKIMDYKNNPIYLNGHSLGSGYAIYMLIIFRYIFKKGNIYAIVNGTLPIIPTYLNDFISKYILSMSHTLDPFTKLTWLTDR